MTLLAEQFVCLAANPKTGRPGLGVRSNMNACLAGLLVADLVLDGAAEIDSSAAAMRLTGKAPSVQLLAAVAQVVAGKGPKIKSVLSGMNRGLLKHLGAGTWQAALVGAGGPGVAARQRDAVLAEIRGAVFTDGPVDQRLALMVSMTGPAQLLELVAPERGDARRYARNRIDHCLDGTYWDCVPKLVRKLIAEANNAAASSVVITG